jgi:glycosyltransferase involved in cell wall biosynthesis
MKRVGVDAHVLDGKFQGSRSFLENLLTEIGRQDTRNVYIVYSADPNRTQTLFPFPQFEHRRIQVRSSSLRLLLFWPWVRLRDRLDVLVTQYIAPPFDTGRQFVVIHDILFESHPWMFPRLMRWRLRLLCRLSARRASMIFTVSDYTRREIARRYGISADHLRVTPNAIARLPPPGPEAMAQAKSLCPFLLCVGRLEPRKNIILALTASADARARGVRLIVVGRSDFGVDQLTAALSEAPNVMRLSDVTPELLAALYRHAVALLFPSFGEGFGIPVLEALAKGTPVLASDRTAIVEVGGDLARYFNPESQDAASTLASLIEQALGGAFRPPPDAIEAHLAHFNWRDSAATVIAAVDALR